MTYELNDQYKPIRKYITGMGMDDYEGHLEYSEVTDWSAHIFSAQYNPPWYTYMRDQVGTVYKVYDHKNHSIADSRAYDSFGNLINQTGTTKTPLGFQGKYYDSESGLNYFYHRYYSPSIGRFTSNDPIKQVNDINLYKFVKNNPISVRDPLGLKPLCIPWFSESKNQEFEKYSSCKGHISVYATGIDPMNIAICNWVKETRGISKNQTRPQKLCFGVAKCGKIIPFVISAGDWKEETKETSEYERVTTRGVSYADGDDPESMAGVWCQNPWSPFNWEWVPIMVP